MPSSTTVAQARTLLARYCGAGNTFLDRLNLACQRLIQSGNWRTTKDVVVFQVHLNEDFTAFITLPRQYNTVEAAVVLRQNDDASRLCGYPLPMQQDWYSFLGSGPGYTGNALYRWGSGFIPETDRFTTFKDWVVPAKLRFKFAAVEANGGIINVRGISGGQPIYTGAGVSTIEGENLTIAGSATLTTTSVFDIPPYGVVKPATYNVVSMFTVDPTSGVETLVARYDPSETVPQWRRYRVPACSGWTEDDPGQFLAICKREWVTVSNDNDTVIPGNLGALRFALNALLREDAEDDTRAEINWGKAYQLLANEVEDDTGDNTHVPVQVQDSFMIGNGATYMGPIPDGTGLGYGGFGGWAGN